MLTTVQSMQYAHTVMSDIHTRILCVVNTVMNSLPKQLDEKWWQDMQCRLLICVPGCLPAKPYAAVEQLEHNARPVLHAVGAEEDIDRALPYHS